MDLPPLQLSDFDVVVYGTGLVESIIAAASARVGRKVLHVDRMVWYGGSTASLSFKQLQEWAKAQDASTAELAVEDSDLLSDLTKFSGKYNFDLVPRMLYGRGLLTDLLARSGVARYLEFQLPGDLFFWSLDNCRFYSVPCSKGALFRSRELGLGEKNVLMRFLRSVVAQNGEEEWSDAESILDHMKRFGLSPKSQSIVLYAIAMLSLGVNIDKSNPTDTEPTAGEVIPRIVRHVGSVGAYGDSPFLVCRFGIGELSQAFCRVCAVYGGVYVLDAESDVSGGVRAFQWLRDALSGTELGSEVHVPAPNEVEIVESLEKRCSEGSRERSSSGAHTHEDVAGDEGPAGQSDEGPAVRSDGDPEVLGAAWEAEADNPLRNGSSKPMRASTGAPPQFVVGIDYMPAGDFSRELPGQQVFQAMVLLDAPLSFEGTKATDMATGGNAVPNFCTFAVIPPHSLPRSGDGRLIDNQNPVHVYQFDSSTQVVRPGEILVYLVMVAPQVGVVPDPTNREPTVKDVRESLEPVLEMFLTSKDDGNEKPKVLMTLFSLNTPRALALDPEIRASVPQNVHVVSDAPPGGLLLRDDGADGCTESAAEHPWSAAGDLVSLDAAVSRAQRVFRAMFPGEEFLPRIPEAEEVQEEMRLAEELKRSEASEATVQPISTEEHEKKHET